MEAVAQRNKEYFTANELANRLGISENTLRVWTRDAGIPHLKIKSRIRYPISEYLAWERSRLNHENR
jgi:excisionase family DNA binding protein